MTIRVTTEIVFDGHHEISQADAFEQENDMEREWVKFEVTNCIVFRKTEEAYCERDMSYCPNCGQRL